MESPKQEEVVLKESLYRKLAYAESFKEIIVNHHGLISTFQNLENQLKEKVKKGEFLLGYSIEERGLKLSPIGTSPTLEEHVHGYGKYPGNKGMYLKVEIQGEAFFVKTKPGYLEKGKASDELLSLKKVKELLNNLKNVEVVDFQLGYQDRDRSYFVSRWEDGITLFDFMMEQRIENSDKESQRILYNKKGNELEERLQQIESRLKDFADVNWQNILYDPKTEKLTVFDVHDKVALKDED